jgi:hypothetical protein
VDCIYLGRIIDTLHRKNILENAERTINPRLCESI